MRAASTPRAPALIPPAINVERVPWLPGRDLVPVCEGRYERHICRLCKGGVWKTTDSEQLAAPEAAQGGSLTCGACARVEHTKCGICFEECVPANLPCYISSACRPDHAYCNTCVQAYLRDKLDSGVWDISCPSPTCAAVLGDNCLKRLNHRGIFSDDDARRHSELRTVSTREYLSHLCSGRDPELLEWMRDNAQTCPACLRVVQRSEGCNHMTCLCGCEFCFGCGNKWPCSRDECRAVNGRVFNHQGVASALPGRPSPSAVAATACSDVPSLQLPASPGTLSAEQAQSAILKMLTLTCPRCERAFVMDADFDDCFSLQCSGCPCRFCAWCLEDGNAAGEDPHTHVLDCPQAPEDMRGSSLFLQEHNGGPHSGDRPHTKFTEHWHARQRERVASLLALLDASVAAEVRSALSDELSRIGLV